MKDIMFFLLLTVLVCSLYWVASWKPVPLIYINICLKLSWEEEKVVEDGHTGNDCQKP